MQKIIIFKIIFTCALIFFITKQVNIDELLSKLHHNHLSFLMLSFLAQHLSLISSSYRSRLYLKAISIFPSLSQNIILYYIGSFYNNFLPGGVSGDGYKIYFLSKHHAVKKLTLLKTFLLERINGVFVLGYFSCILFYLSDFRIHLSHISYFILFIIIIGIPAYLFISKKILNDHSALKALPYSICTQLLQLIMIYCIILSFDYNLDFKSVIDYILLFAIASILSIFPITIGGIGIRETIFFLGTNFIPNLDQDLGILIASTSFLISLLASITGGLLSIKKIS